MSEFDKMVRDLAIGTICKEAGVQPLDAALDFIAAGLAEKTNRFYPTRVIFSGLEVYVCTDHSVAQVINGQIELVDKLPTFVNYESPVITHPSPAIRQALRRALGMTVVD